MRTYFKAVRPDGTDYRTGEAPNEPFGPQGEHVTRLIAALEKMTPEQAIAAVQAKSPTAPRMLPASCDAAWTAAHLNGRGAARDAARRASMDAARSALRSAFLYVSVSFAGEAATALVVRDLIPQKRYDTLTRPLRTAGITVHPDDKEL